MVKLTYEKIYTWFPWTELTRNSEKNIRIIHIRIKWDPPVNSFFLNSPKLSKVCQKHLCTDFVYWPEQSTVFCPALEASSRQFLLLHSHFVQVIVLIKDERSNWRTAQFCSNIHLDKTNPFLDPTVLTTFCMQFSITRSQNVLEFLVCLFLCCRLCFVFFSWKVLKFLELWRAFDWSAMKDACEIPTGFLHQISNFPTHTQFDKTFVFTTKNALQIEKHCTIQRHQLQLKQAWIWQEWLHFPVVSSHGWVRICIELQPYKTRLAFPLSGIHPTKELNLDSANYFLFALFTLQRNLGRILIKILAKSAGEFSLFFESQSFHAPSLRFDLGTN